MGVGQATTLEKTCSLLEGKTVFGRFFSCGLDRGWGFCPNRPVKENGNGQARRKEELLAKLVERARTCPGLYPVKSREEFLRLAVDLGTGGEESLCRILEGMWQRPDEALQINAQSLIRRGKGWAEKKKAGSQPSDQAAG